MVWLHLCHRGAAVKFLRCIDSMPDIRPGRKSLPLVSDLVSVWSFGLKRKHPAYHLPSPHLPPPCQNPPLGPGRLAVGREQGCCFMTGGIWGWVWPAPSSEARAALEPHLHVSQSPAGISGDAPCPFKYEPLCCSFTSKEHQLISVVGAILCRIGIKSSPYYRVANPPSLQELDVYLQETTKSHLGDK